MKNKDPVAFAEKFFNWKAHEGQKKILRSQAQFLTVAAGRRFGKSEAMAVLALYEAVKAPERIVFIIAPTYDQSMVIFESVVRFLGKSPLHDLVKRTRYSPYPLLQLVHGGEIHARSADKPNNLRGRKAHMVILDEAAFVKDSAVYDVIEPMLADFNGRLIKISTPYGKNHFYDSFMKGLEGVKGYESFRFPSMMNPYISREFLELKKMEYGETSLRWRVEYEAEFVDDDSVVFPWSIIEDVVEDYSLPVRPQSGHMYSMGVDIAKYQDYTVIIVIDVTEKPNRVVHFERFNQRSWSYVMSRIETIYKRYNPRGYIDVTGVGDPIYEQLQARGVRLQPFKFTPNTKQELIDNLRVKFEMQEIVIPMLKDLLDELRFFEYKETEGGYVKMEAKSGYHDDTVIALALAAYMRPTTVATSKIVLPSNYIW